MYHFVRRSEESMYAVVLVTHHNIQMPIDMWINTNSNRGRETFIKKTKP